MGLERMSRVSTGGGSCCHLSVHPTATHLGAANHGQDFGEPPYPPGSTAVISLDPVQALAETHCCCCLARLPTAAYCCHCAPPSMHMHSQSAGTWTAVAVAGGGQATGDVLQQTCFIEHQEPAEKPAGRDDWKPHAHSANWSPCGAHRRMQLPRHVTLHRKHGVQACMHGRTDGRTQACTRAGKQACKSLQQPWEPK